MTSQDIIPFNFKSKQIRVIAAENGEPLFVGKDLCEALGYTDHINAMKQHCRGVVKRHPIIDSLGRTQEVRVLHEGDMFRLIVNSKLESAQEFEAWVFDEVLPSIRKNGSYCASQFPSQSPADFASKDFALEPFENQDMQIKVDMIREARALFGANRARLLWEQVGLPQIPNFQQPSNRTYLTSPSQNYIYSDVNPSEVLAILLKTIVFSKMTLGEIAPIMFKDSHFFADHYYGLRRKGLIFNHFEGEEEGMILSNSADFIRSAFDIGDKYRGAYNINIDDRPYHKALLKLKGAKLANYHMGFTAKERGIFLPKELLVGNNSIN